MRLAVMLGELEPATSRQDGFGRIILACIIILALWGTTDKKGK